MWVIVDSAAEPCAPITSPGSAPGPSARRSETAFGDGNRPACAKYCATCGQRKPLYRWFTLDSLNEAWVTVDVAMPGRRTMDSNQIRMGVCCRRSKGEREGMRMTVDTAEAFITEADKWLAEDLAELEYWSSIEDRKIRDRGAVFPEQDGQDRKPIPGPRWVGRVDRNGRLKFARIERTEVKPEQCSKPLARGRVCVLTAGHEDRHSHTWHRGENRYGTVKGRRVNMETGEVLSDSWDDVDSASYRGNPDPIRVLESHLPGFTMPDDDGLRGLIATLPSKPVDGYSWHYASPTHSYGVKDATGVNVEFEHSTGKLQWIVSLNQRARVTAHARKVGAASASRKSGIPAAAIRQWLRRSAE